MTTMQPALFFSHDEIVNQGYSLRQTLTYVQQRASELTAFFDQKDYDEILFLACGSSYWLSLSAQETVAENLHIRVSSVTSGDMLMNPGQYQRRYSRPLVICPSRSGSTSETLSAVAWLKAHYGCRVLALTEYGDSPLEAVADLTLHLPWANETSVCQTRSFSNLYLALVATAAYLSDNQVLIDDLNRYLDQIDSLSQRAEAFVQALLADQPNLTNLVTLGNGKLYGLACEGAYITVEMAQAPAHFFYTLEFRHGPIVMLNGSYLMVMFSNGDQNALENDLVTDMQINGASVLVVAPENNHHDGPNAANWVLSPPAGSGPEVVGLYGSLVTQLLAHYKALQAGVNPDQPKDLVPWIKI